MRAKNFFSELQLVSSRSDVTNLGTTHQILRGKRLATGTSVTFKPFFVWAERKEARHVQRCGWSQANHQYEGDLASTNYRASRTDRQRYYYRRCCRLVQRGHGLSNRPRPRAPYSPWRSRRPRFGGPCLAAHLSL